MNLDVEIRTTEEDALGAAWRAGELVGQFAFSTNQCRSDAGGITNYLHGRDDHTRQMHYDPEIKKAVKEAVAVFDPVKRPQALNDMYKMLHDEQVEMNVGYINTPWGLGSRVDAWQPWPLALHITGRHTITLK